MSTIERTINTLDGRESVVTISTNSRIDYVLRFSKQAILVIDDSSERFINVGNEFLGSLPDEHNAAYVPISSKMNDIQIRCRIIEQLFGSTLFDPEQPLSVNVIKLSETKNEAITIVVANAEYLSQQLTHEMCQLAEIAKKLNKTINVLLLGKTEMAISLSENKHLFENKISILLADNGQLLSINSPLLKNISTKNIITRYLIIIFGLLLITITAGYFLLASDNRNKNEDLKLKEPEDVISQEYKQDFVNLNYIETNTEEVFSDNLADKGVSPTQVSVNLFSPEDLSTGSQADEIIVTEAENDSNNAADTLVLNNDEQQRVVDINSAMKKSNETDVKNNFNELMNHNYYQSTTEGYVIQLAGFTKIAGYTNFIKTHKGIELYGFARETDGVVSYVVTSKVYLTNTKAKAAIQELPKVFKASGPWVKSILTINNEINLYQETR